MYFKHQVRIQVLSSFPTTARFKSCTFWWKLWLEFHTTRPRYCVTSYLHTSFVKERSHECIWYPFAKQDPCQAGSHYHLSELCAAVLVCAPRTFRKSDSLSVLLWYRIFGYCNVYAGFSLFLSLRSVWTCLKYLPNRDFSSGSLGSSSNRQTGWKAVPMHMSAIREIYLSN